MKYSMVRSYRAIKNFTNLRSLSCSTLREKYQMFCFFRSVLSPTWIEYFLYLNWICIFKSWISVNLRIQSENGKTRTRKNSVFGLFSWQLQRIEETKIIYWFVMSLQSGSRVSLYYAELPSKLFETFRAICTAKLCLRFWKSWKTIHGKISHYSICYKTRINQAFWENH